MVQARNFVMQPETKPWLLPSLSRFAVYLNSAYISRGSGFDVWTTNGLKTQVSSTALIEMGGATVYFRLAVCSEQCAL